jgi:uncharacterized protein (TIRG00374 family)
LSTENNKSFDFGKIKKGIVIYAILGIAVFAIIGMYADFESLKESISKFDFSYLPLILLLAPMNYVLRYVKWNYYLHQLKIKIPLRINLPVFVAGLSMTVTPAKVGEFFKSYLLREFCGVEMSKTMPMVLMERVSDAISMIILASIGAIAFEYGYAAIIACVCIIVLFVAVIRIKPFAMFVIRMLSKNRFLKKFADAFENFYIHTYELTRLDRLGVAVGIGTISWFFEGLVVFLALKAFGVDFSILGSVFTVSVSSLVGALSMLPGGLIAAEGSIMGVLVVLFGVNKVIASATTIVTRISTLWLGVVLGIVGLVVVQKMLKKRMLKKEEELKNAE